MVAARSSQTAASFPSKPRMLFSFVIDVGPWFAWKGYHLARSIFEHCSQNLFAIHVHATPEVAPRDCEILEKIGCTVCRMERFGDGRYCNKIAQVSNLPTAGYDIVVLLDTDTIFINDITPYLHADAIQAKVVDAPNPSLHTLKQVADLAKIARLPPIMITDSGSGETYSRNCNGGLYVIPSVFLPIVESEWPRWARWLLQNIEPLRREGREAHVDQVAMWLTLCANDLPFSEAPSNLNYFVHFAAEHRYFRPDHPICLIHYHNTVDGRGRIESRFCISEEAAEAVAKANSQISQAVTELPLLNCGQKFIPPDRGC